MKKLIALLLLVCLLPLCAAAEIWADDGVTVVLDGAEIFFTPIEGYCLTRKSSASVFNRLGLSQREVVPWMEETDVYALLFNAALDTEIQISATPTSDMDFDDLNKFGLDMTCETIENLYIMQGYEVESVGMCHTPDGHSYVEIVASYTYEDGYVAHMVGYFTCQSGYAVSVLLFSYEGALTEEQIFLCESVIDSLWVTKSTGVGAYE